MLGPPEAALVEEYKDIPMRDGFQSSIKIHKPATTPAGGSPLIIFCFGGGFIAGDNDAGTVYARAWARLFGAVTVNISYRLAPQYKFPISQYDAIDSAKWIAEHASELGADPTKGFIVGGISAGATQTAVITNASFTDGFKYPITGQWLSVPSLMDDVTVPEKYKKYFLSRKHNTDVPILPASAIDDLKVHIEWDEKSPLRYPILSEVPLSKLPPAYLQADGLDPLRDDALIYEEMLKEAGVKTKIDFYPYVSQLHAWMEGFFGAHGRHESILCPCLSLR
jgi:acetyl esterase/lipase